MAEIRPADHAMGLELQIEELTEQRRRAQVQHRDEDAKRLSKEIEDLQAELAMTAELSAREGSESLPPPELHNAAELNITEEPD
jgi:hypothetical protein